MKYTLAFLFCVTISITGFAQDSTRTDVNYTESKHPDNDDKKGGFHKENLFTGGSVIISLSSYGTVLGANPVFGYSITDWLDAGVSLNFTFNSQRTYDYAGDVVEKDRQLILGPGVFVKVYPTDYLFIQAQYEDNFISDKQILVTSGYSGTFKTSAASYLTGIGYCGGREGKGSLYYYIAVLVDLGNNYYSPYLYHFSDGSTSIAPIFRAGLQIPLFQGRGHY
jgi:hypothetical protein